MKTLVSQGFININSFPIEGLQYCYSDFVKFWHVIAAYSSGTHKIYQAKSLLPEEFLAYE